MQAILVIEDHAEARSAMIDVVREAFNTPTVIAVATLTNARQRLAEYHFDLIVTDLGLPDGKGEDFISEIQQSHPNAYVVVSTIYDESDRLLAALENGAKGYLLKELPKAQLVEEFRGLLSGRPPLAPAVTRRLLEYFRKEQGADHRDPRLRVSAIMSADREDGIESLTSREQEILVLLAKGFNRPEIAGLLNISKYTVATHVDKIYRKLGVSTRSEAAVLAGQHNLL